MYNKQEIINIMKKMGYVNKLISYEEFKEFYQKLGSGIKESYFAEILGISNNDFLKLKNEGFSVTILKFYFTNNKYEDEIRNSLIEKGYTNTAISYEEFKKLYKYYDKNIKESEFAQILGIKYANYNNMKNKGTRARILKYSKMDLTAEEKTQIIKKVEELGYKSNDSISYEDFLLLYQKCEVKIKETDFAQILSINYSNYNNMKNKGTRAKILKKYIIQESEKSNLDCIEILYNCYKNGMQKKEAIEYVRNICNMSNREILNKLNEIDKDNQR